ncbi:MAG: ATP-binding protein [Firmicutes bacterium]|nr:ATP-binding protein [Bacillota bacterium]
MKNEINPYTPAFGTPPTAYIHREQIENQIMNEFCGPGSVPMSYMIIGARGTGKTVLMHEIANRFETSADWVVARMNPNVDMLDSLLHKLAGHKKAAPAIKSAKINLAFFGLTVDFSTPQIKDVEEAIAEIVKGLRDNEKRLLIIVDEATNTASMKKFASAYQNLIGQKLPVYLLMTGLYENISRLKNEKNLTFLYRMPRILLSPLSLNRIRENYMNTLEVDVAAAEMMADITKGYSYGFQLLGKLTWDNRGEYTEILETYRSTLYEMVYEKIWEEMSDTDKYVMFCAATTEGTRVTDIRKAAGQNTNLFSTYKDRLIKKGLLHSSRYGHVEIALPFFKGFILQRYEGRRLARSEDLPDDL